MTRIDIRRYRMFVRVLEFEKTNPQWFRGPVAIDAIATIARMVGHVARHAVPTSCARRGRPRCADARDGLLRQLEALARTARLAASRDDGATHPLPLDARNEHTLLQTGWAAIQHVKANRALFVRYGMPETVAEELFEAVRRFEQAIAERNNFTADRAAIHAMIAAALMTAASAVRHLDVVVPNQLATHPGALAAWRAVRRVEHARECGRRGRKPSVAGTSDDAFAARG